MLFLPFLKSETAVVTSCDEFLLQKGSTLSYGEVFFFPLRVGLYEQSVSFRL